MKAAPVKCAQNSWFGGSRLGTSAATLLNELVKWTTPKISTNAPNANFASRAAVFNRLETGAVIIAMARNAADTRIACCPIPSKTPRNIAGRKPKKCGTQ